MRCRQSGDETGMRVVLRHKSCNAHLLKKVFWYFDLRLTGHWRMVWGKFYWGCSCSGALDRVQRSNPSGPEVQGIQSPWDFSGIRFFGFGEFANPWSFSSASNRSSTSRVIGFQKGVICLCSSSGCKAAGPQSLPRPGIEPGPPQTEIQIKHFRAKNNKIVKNF